MISPKIRINGKELYIELNYMVDKFIELKHLELSDEFKHELLLLIVIICNENTSMSNVSLGYRLVFEMFSGMKDYYDDLDISEHILNYMKNTPYIGLGIGKELISKLENMLSEIPFELEKSM